MTGYAKVHALDGTLPMCFQLMIEGKSPLMVGISGWRHQEPFKSLKDAELNARVPRSNAIAPR
jgi:hypothetical protein